MNSASSRRFFWVCLPVISVGNMSATRSACLFIPLHGFVLVLYISPTQTYCGAMPFSSKEGIFNFKKACLCSPLHCDFVCSEPDPCGQLPAGLNPVCGGDVLLLLLIYSLRFKCDACSYPCTLGSPAESSSAKSPCWTVCFLAQCPHGEWWWRRLIRSVLSSAPMQGDTITGSCV